MNQLSNKLHKPKKDTRRWMVGTEMSYITSIADNSLNKSGH